MNQSDFKDYIVGDILNEIEGISARAMFGGFGLYKNGIIFGIIADDGLYFKVDDSNAAEYRAFDSSPFTYERGNHQKTTMSYWLIPHDMLEDRERVQELALASVRINKQNRSSKKRRA